LNNGEKIDIVRWSEDIKTYAINALSPAHLSSVEIKDVEGEHIIHVIADADQLSLAIGKRVQNVRLSAKLLGWKIDIHKDESNISFEEKVSLAIKHLAEVDGITEETAQALVGAGFLTVDGILEADPKDIAEMIDIGVVEAQDIYKAVEENKKNTEK
jgi:N utilization substance protein A